MLLPPNARVVFFCCTDLASGRVQPTDARRWGQFLVPKRLKWNGWKPLDQAEAWAMGPSWCFVGVAAAAFRRLFGNGKKTTFREVSPSWLMFGEQHETWWQLLKSTRRAIPTRANEIIHQCWNSKISIDFPTWKIHPISGYFRRLEEIFPEWPKKVVFE